MHFHFIGCKANAHNVGISKILLCGYMELIILTCWVLENIVEKGELAGDCQVYSKADSVNQGSDCIFYEVWSLF